MAEPGFDFIRLTKPQWRYLKEVEKRHGIPWHIYIRDLIKEDMERGSDRSTPVISIDLENVIARLEDFLRNPADFMPSWQPSKPEPGSANFSGIINEEHIKPSAVKKHIEVLPPEPKFQSGQVFAQKVSLMVELRQVLGLPPLDTKRRLMMTRPVVSGELAPPPDPPPSEDESS